MRPYAAVGAAGGAACRGAATTRAEARAPAASACCSGTGAAMLPSVSLPWSPYSGGIGQLADADAVEHDDDRARKGARPRRGVRRLDATRSSSATLRGVRMRRDGVLEHHVIDAAVLDDQREAIEVLDAAFELAAVHQVDR